MKKLYILPAVYLWVSLVSHSKQLSFINSVTHFFVIETCFSWRWVQNVKISLGWNSCFKTTIQWDASGSIFYVGTNSSNSSPSTNTNTNTLNTVILYSNFNVRFKQVSSFREYAYVVLKNNVSELHRADHNTFVTSLNYQESFGDEFGRLNFSAPFM